MTISVYTASFYGEIYKLRADFTQSASQIEREDEDGNWVPTGKQVADFSHRAELAMEWELEHVFEACGEEMDTADKGEVMAAVSRMTSYDKDEEYESLVEFFKRDLEGEL